MGTIALSLRTPAIINQWRGVAALVAPSASYATGGETIDLTALGLKTVEEVYIPCASTLFGMSGLSVQLAGTLAAPKLKFFDAANTEVVAATNLSARTVYMIFLGKGG